jgi:hypothetical protein
MITKSISNNEYNQLVVTSIRNGRFIVSLQRIIDVDVIDEERGLIYESLVQFGVSLNVGEEQLLQGYSPVSTWYVEEIKLWLNKSNIQYSASDNKSSLLSLCPVEQIVPIDNKQDWVYKHLPCRVTVPKYAIMGGERYEQLALDLLKVSAPHEVLGENIRVYLPSIATENQPALDADPEVIIEYL